MSSVSCTFVLHGGADEGIDADEFQLNVGTVERHPFAVDEFIEVDIEYEVVLDCVESRCGSIVFEIVMNVSCAKDASLLEHPIGQCQSELFIARLAGPRRTERRSLEIHKTRFDLLLALIGFNRAEEEIVAEEVQRANETNACVVTSLKNGDQQCAFANGTRILDNRSDDVLARMHRPWLTSASVGSSGLAVYELDEPVSTSSNNGFS